MDFEKYQAYYQEGGQEEITKISLSDDEWLVFLQNASNHDIINIDTNDGLSNADIEWIDTNQCVPICRNDSFIQRYDAETRMASVVCGDRGNIFLRLWLAENGINSSLNNTMSEIFPGGLPEEILNSFWQWWQTVPIEPQSVGNILVSKHRQEFGIGHLYVWVKSLIKEDEPKAAGERYVFNLKPWMYAHELYILWVDGNLLLNHEGRMLPTSNIT